MKPITRLMYAFSLLLLGLAVAAAIVIGMKARNLMVTGVVTSLAVFACGRMHEKNDAAWLYWSCRLLPLAAFVLFFYRANVNLLALIGIVQHELDQYDAYNKCINVVFLLMLAAASLTAFLIAASMNERKNA